MIDIRNLTKRFAQHTAVDDLSFQVQPGEVLGFLGPNGAGKSTTMKMLTGFLAPTSGTASILGCDIQTQTLKAQRQIGYLPEGAPCYGDMTVRGFLGFIAEVRGYRGAEKHQRVAKAEVVIDGTEQHHAQDNDEQQSRAGGDDEDSPLSQHDRRLFVTAETEQPLPQ